VTRRDTLASAHESDGSLSYADIRTLIQILLRPCYLQCIREYGAQNNSYAKTSFGNRSASGAVIAALHPFGVTR
jgi:hypothetical protein